MPILEVDHLSKKFKGNNFYSLKDVNFTVNKGDIVGLVGKNGAGKSTLLKSIAKSYIPTSGTIKYKGTDIRSKDNMLDDFGILIYTVFYPQLSVVDNLKLYLQVHHKEQYLKNIPEILKLVDLYDAKDRKPDGFSFGMKQRIGVAIALIAEPSFLLLDEPFVGLDQVGVNRLINILQTWAKNREISMLVSSHQLANLEDVCNRYLFIDSGQLVNYSNTSERGDIIVSLQKDVQSPADLLEVKINDKPLITQIDDRINISQNTSAQLLNELMKFLSARDAIKSISTEQNSLKSYFNKKG
ncbi:putative ABC transporter ATP-binding protein YxlF [Lactobacillus helveticus]|uniref:ABC transporter ATP-binding protein YxlF n=1 Tax=Lactobacillus helveticus TaxID=1587 RepID=A0A9Q5G8E5_LACHE|nr:ABC transporter ATP-binding protein [Lactobacillus helveticus]NRN89306.1 putative ABC transporter ATP-binding protein YxlF [Lactobacillus helveticus]NRN94104.1 putative ABC transporter ATP-binding protein YxlF [Lactobacillus helveticus]NRO26528.1 putative ABC transporter ATP-binding protein YxlF [Lactobacillus helveticus]NRO30815.1 putative ABC transporter ATP-binding protein YxlF [Lactobacillus helveticus]NRO34768.1 putative ABC transporter ATP-binding protein YxlF [Lactobacillus helveticu